MHSMRNSVNKHARISSAILEHMNSKERKQWLKLLRKAKKQIDDYPVIGLVHIMSPKQEAALRAELERVKT